jgi:protein pelota
LLFRWVDGRKALFLKPLNSQDIWTLRRIISRGDQVQSWTTREVKLEGEFQRPDKGRRVSVKVKVDVESVNFDSDLGRLRIRGRIVESDNELVPHGSYHSIEVQPTSEITLWRDAYPSWMLGLLSKRGKVESTITVALDSREAGVGLLTGVTLKFYGTIESGISGKAYSQDHDKLARAYFHNIADLLRTVLQASPEAKVVLAGPGNLKNQFNNYLSNSASPIHVGVLDGYDLAGEDGVRLLLAHSAFRELLANTEFSHVQELVDKSKISLAKNDGRLAMGFSACQSAAAQGAVDSMLISDAAFRISDEDSVVKLANDVEAKAGEVALLDSSTLLGGQVDGLGGAVALLRYPISTFT